MSCLTSKHEGQVALGGARAGYLVESCLPFGLDEVGWEEHPRGRELEGLLEGGPHPPGLKTRQLSRLDDLVETLTEV